MRIAIVHEHWGAGAARCAHDLRAALGQSHEVAYFPQAGDHSLASVLAGLSDFKPDLVNCHSFYGDLPYEALPAISRRFPVCFTVHDPRPIGTMETICWMCDRNRWCLDCPIIPKRWRRLLRNRFFYERLKKRLSHMRCPADLRIVAPSQWMADRLGQQELRRFRIDTIPYGIDLKKFQPAPAQRERFGLPTNAPVLLHVAWHSGAWTINQRKGLRHLAEAFVRSVVPRFPSAVLAVAGEAFAPNHPNVRPLGMIAQEDLPALLGAVDVFVSPTLADNLPYTVLEAMGCGRAVVASRVGGIPEQVLDGETGFLVAPGNDEELGQALVRLLSSPDQIAQFGAAGRRRAEQLFGMEKFVRAYEALFNDIAGRPRRGRPGGQINS